MLSTRTNIKYTRTNNTFQHHNFFRFVFAASVVALYPNGCRSVLCLMFVETTPIFDPPGRVAFDATADATATRLLDRNGLDATAVVVAVVAVAFCVRNRMPPIVPMLRSRRALAWATIDALVVGAFVMVAVAAAAAANRARIGNCAPAVVAFVVVVVGADVVRKRTVAKAAAADAEPLTMCVRG